MHTNAHYDVPTELDHCLRQTVSVLGLDQLASSVFFWCRVLREGIPGLRKSIVDLKHPRIMKVEPALFGSKLMNKPVQCFEKSSLRHTCPLLCF